MFRATALAAALGVTCFTLAMLADTAQAHAATPRSRADIPTEFKWDFSPIYPDWAAWETGMAEMERQMGINDDILRFMTIRVDALEEGPSAMMQKRDRDDERGDRPGGPRGDRGGFDRGDRRPPRRF